MKKLSVGQYERASEILGNITVAWFSAGAISPLFVKPAQWLEFIPLFILSLTMAGLFFIWSLSLARRVKP